MCYNYIRQAGKVFPRNPGPDRLVLIAAEAADLSLGTLLDLLAQL